MAGPLLKANTLEEVKASFKGLETWTTKVQSVYETKAAAATAATTATDTFETKAFAAATYETIVNAAATYVPIDTPWTSWTPTFGASGSMTYTSVTATAKYMIVEGTTYFWIDADGITGGTASTQLRFTLPVTSAVSNRAFACFVDLGGPIEAGFTAVRSNRTECGVFRYAAGNWPLVASAEFQVNGFYEND